MRLDKFLAVSRLIKRRGESKAACELGFVSVNGRPAKPSKEVKPGDKIMIQFKHAVVGVEIIELPHGPVKKDKASSFYRILFVEKISEGAEWV